MTEQKVPLLALPNVVFFPGSTLSLYVVEPVYMRMIEDAAENHLPIAIALTENELTFGQFDNDHKPPQLFTSGSPKRICTIGIPKISDNGPGHGIHVVVKGQSRVSLGQLVQNIPFPVYEVTPLPEISSQVNLIPKTITNLSKLLEQWIDFNVIDSVERAALKRDISNVQQIVSYIITFMIKDIELKQIFLETDDLVERIYMLTAVLSEQYPHRENVLHKKSIFEFETIENTYPLAN